jgi:Ca2+-transporting ATPase
MKSDGVVTPYELTVFFATFIMLQFWNLFNARSLGLRESSFRGIFKNKGFMIIAAGILIGQILIIQIGGEFFRTVPIKATDWLIIIASTSLVYVIGEIVRRVK